MLASLLAQKENPLTIYTPAFAQEHIVNSAYHRNQQREKVASRPAPYWSLAYTDEALIR